jgi:DNA-binding NarL/FixJ family response regulator
MHRKRHYAPANVPFMTAPERDATIVSLYEKGWSVTRIAKAVGMSRGGVEFALERIVEGRPGRDPRA